MCGIVGVCHTRGRSVGDELERMNEQIVHRGPDDQGLLRDREVGLGIRRLSIIDLAGGHQPLANEDGTNWIVFNGEIYNYRSLTAELKQRGHTFRTHSDTETIVHAYEEFGADCVHRFNGMFAFAIWNKAQRQLFLARDRLGVKPLYYYWDGETLIFGSEIKAVLASGLIKKEINAQALWHYLTFRYVPAPMTMWVGIFKLPPGHRMVLDLDSRSLDVERYWEIHYAEAAEPRGESDDLAAFSELFLDAVRLRLVADVPVGIFLSGGLDSSAVAAAVREVHNAPLNTFSVAFKDGGEFSEFRYARQVAQHVGTRHHEIEIGLDEFVDFLPQFVWHTDEPLGDPASIPLYYVSKLAAQHVKVVLSGEGADEVLGGYSFDEAMRYWERIKRFQRLPRVVRETAPEMLLRVLGWNEMLKRLQTRNLPLEQHTMLGHMTNFFTSLEKRTLWPAAPSLDSSDDLIRSYYERSNTSSPLHQSLYAYCQDWLVEDLLMKADKMTMAASIELRVPFLDYRLVEWLASRGPEAKVRAMPDGRYVTKYLLREF